MVDLQFMDGAMANRILMLSITRNFRPMAILYLCCLIVASPNHAQESPDEIALSPGYGYLLIRLICPNGERIARFEMTNLETGDVITTRSDMYKAAGQKAWMGLIALPEGRYFWSKYEPVYRTGLESPRHNPVLTRNAPSSASDTFEITPGVINYAGDWVMYFRSIRQNPIVSHDAKTIQRLVDRYPEHVKRYEVYLSMMGKKGVSLKEFLRIVEEHSDSVIE